MSNTLLRIYPSELKIPFELKRQNSGILELTNKTDHHVAFKVKTTNPKKYSVRPTTGVVLPRGSSGITVTMQPPKEIPADYHCKDKFLIQSVVVEEGTTLKDIHTDMFSKEPGKVVEEFKLRVVYIPANPPSPVPEEEEEETDSPDSDVDYELKMPSTSDAASRQGYTSGSQASHNEGVSLTKAVLSKYVDENQKLQQELDLLKKKRSSSVGGFSALFVLFVLVFSAFVGYFMSGSYV
ncbi:hypothetical protein E2562_024688 [Oryza meyeriana var. granulata]|uniref:MSP domain-containing protein n=1 Tax=Oryza meyeriana var. granulata TaxID=110450 RepID=A0A6G1EAI4_9ORYZ|nr:hypothetical protein E2562_024688 [Oryza meyeriana var. granulata]